MSARPDDPARPERSAHESADAPDPAGAARAGRARRLLGALLRTPLFHRILFANALVVALGAAAGTAVSVHVGRSWSGSSTLVLAASFAAVGLALSLVVNGLLVRWLLSPLERLEAAAARIRRGGEPLEEDVVVPPTADPGLQRLVEAFNGMLSSLGRHRSRLRGMAAGALEGREQERIRLARVLQEDTAQRVASSLVRLQWIRGLGEGPERDRALEELRDDLGDTLESIRDLARLLRPPELDDLGLDDALRALARDTREHGGPDVRLELEDVDGLLPREARLTVYRTVEAMLRSWSPGARDAPARVTLERREDAVVAEVGIDAEAEAPESSPAEDGTRSELFVLRERARFSDGHLDVDRRPDGGLASVRLRMPVPSAPRAAAPDRAAHPRLTSRTPEPGRPHP